MSTPYVTLEECAAYHAQRLTSSAWLAIENKDAAILMASDYIDANYTFLGVKTNPAQEREFPRNGATALPYMFVCAVCELALMSTQLTETKAADKKTVKIGSIAIEYKDSTVESLSYVSKLLHQMTTSPSNGANKSVVTAKLSRS